MGIRINTNISSLSTQRTLNTNSAAESKASDKLANGSRIVQASDDAAGLSISSHLNADIRSSQQALRNANDGVSMVQIAEGSLTSIAEILTRFREMAIQSSSDTINDTERRMLNTEVQHLGREIDRIAETTEFQGKKLLTGGGHWPVFDVQVGIRSEQGDQLGVDRRSINVSLDHLGLHGLDFSTKENAREFLGDIDGAIETVSAYRATLGSLQSRFSTIADGLGNSVGNLSAANSRIKDADVAHESSEMIRARVMREASTALLSQANQMPNMALKLIG